MKRNYIKVLLAWSIASSVWCVADEHQPSTKIAPPPPPAIKSPYFTNESFGKTSSITSETGLEEESNHQATAEKQSVEKNPSHSDENDDSKTVSNDSSDGLENNSQDETKEKSEDASKLSDEAESDMSVNSHDSDKASNSEADDFSKKEEAFHKDELLSDVSKDESQLNDHDVSTGIQGASVTKGIDFESSDDEDKFSIEGVDTSHTKHSSGNWIEKKRYWYEIEGIVDQVKEKVADITQQRMAFFATRSEVDKELSTFYQHIGLDQGPFQDMIHYALEIMEKEKEHQGYLNRKERAFYDKAQSKQRIFEQLKEDIKAIGMIDTKIDEALEVVLKQINACTEYEGEVWNIYKMVAYELSEHDAEQYYLTAQAFLKDVENIQMYLSGPFQTYFQELAASMQTHTQNIVMQLDALQKDGLDLKKEAAIFESVEESDHNQANVKEELRTKEEKLIHEESGISKGKGKSKGFSLLGSVSHFFTSMRDNILSVVKKVAQFFTWHSKKSDIPVAKKTIKSAVHAQDQTVQEPVKAEQQAQSDVKSEPVNARHSEDDLLSKKVTAELEKEEALLVKKSSQIEKTVGYDEERFKQEMEELKRSIESGVSDIVSAPGDMLRSFEKKE